MGSKAERISANYFSITGFKAMLNNNRYLLIESKRSRWIEVDGFSIIT